MYTFYWSFLSKVDLNIAVIYFFNVFFYLSIVSFCDVPNCNLDLILLCYVFLMFFTQNCCPLDMYVLFKKYVLNIFL